MHLLKKVRPLLAILGFMALSAVCAMAQAEINPDHFDDNPPQAPAIHQIPPHKAASAAVTHHPLAASEMHAHSNGSVPSAKSRAQQGSAAETEGVTNHDAVNHATAQKRHKKLVSEARHHGMP